MAIKERISVEFVIKDEYDGKGMKQAKRDLAAVNDEGKKVEGTFTLIRSKMDSFMGSLTPLNQGVELLSKIGRAGKEAFDFVDQGAKLNQQAQSLRNVGIELDRVVEAGKRASGGLVSERALQSAVARFDAFGLSIDRLPDVVEQAVKASRRMGLEADRALDDLVTGIARAEPRILDNLGLLVKLSDLQEAAAKSTGKQVDELTTLETRAATLTLAVEQLAERNKGVSVTALDAANALGSLRASLDDVWTGLKRTAAEATTAGIRLASVFSGDLSMAVEARDRLNAIQAVLKGTGPAAEEAGSAMAEYAKILREIEGLQAGQRARQNFDPRTQRATRGDNLAELLRRQEAALERIAEKYGMSVEFVKRVGDEHRRNQEFLDRQNTMLGAMGHLDEVRLGVVRDQNAAVDAQVQPMLRIVEKVSGMAAASRLQVAYEEQKLDLFTRQEGALARQQTIYHEMLRSAAKQAKEMATFVGPPLEAYEPKKPTGGGGRLDDLTAADRLRTAALYQQLNATREMGDVDGLRLTLLRSEEKLRQVTLMHAVKIAEIEASRATAAKKWELGLQEDLRAAKSRLDIEREIEKTKAQIAERDRQRKADNVIFINQAAMEAAQRRKDLVEQDFSLDLSGVRGTEFDVEAKAARIEERFHAEQMLILKQKELTLAQAIAEAKGNEDDAGYKAALAQAEHEATLALTSAEEARAQAHRQNFASAAREVSQYASITSDAISQTSNIVNLLEEEFSIITAGSKSAADAQQRLWDVKRALMMAESLAKHFQYVGEAAAAAASEDYAGAVGYSIAATAHGVVAGINAAAIGTAPPGKQTSTASGGPSETREAAPEPATVIYINNVIGGPGQELGVMLGEYIDEGEASGMAGAA